MKEVMHSFDTYQYIEDLQKQGFNEGQAKLIIKSILESKELDLSKVATKEQINSIEKDIAALKEDIVGVRNELKESVASLNEKIDSVRSEVKEDASNLRAEVKEEIANLRTEVKEEIASLRTEVKEEITNLRTEVKEEITNLRTEVKEEIANLRAEVKEDIANLRTELKEEMAKYATKEQLGEMKSEVIKWMVSLVLISIGLNVALVGFVIKLLLPH